MNGDFAWGVEAVLAYPALLMGLSHIVQPALWREFFRTLHEMGPRGVIWRTFALELWPAAAVVALHPVWHGSGIIVTLYGYALMLKISVGLLMPEIGLKSLAMAERHGDRGFRLAGIPLMGLGLLCAWRTFNA